MPTQYLDFDSYLMSTLSTPLVSCIFLAVVAAVSEEDTNPLQSIKQSITNNNPYIHMLLHYSMNNDAHRGDEIEGRGGVGS